MIAQLGFRPAVGMLVVSLLACSVSGAWPDSPDGRFSATKTGTRTNAHFQIVEKGTGRTVFTTHGEFPDSPNDVKAGQFSPDSKRFAAAYHYSHAGAYTWIGVWSTETGKLDQCRRVPGFTTSLAGAFNETHLCTVVGSIRESAQANALKDR